MSEVLDFARPIKFDLATADLNALCDDAVRATSVGYDARSDHAGFGEPGPRPVETDAERLRLALVNILTNARHAVLASTAATATGSAEGAATALAGEPDRALP